MTWRILWPIWKWWQFESGSIGITHQIKRTNKFANAISIGDTYPYYSLAMCIRALQSSSFICLLIVFFLLLLLLSRLIFSLSFLFWAVHEGSFFFVVCKVSNFNWVYHWVFPDFSWVFGFKRKRKPINNGIVICLDSISVAYRYFFVVCSTFK